MKSTWRTESNLAQRIAIHFQKCNLTYFPNAVFTYLKKCCPVSEDVFFASTRYSLFLPTVVSLVKRRSVIHWGLIHACRSVTLMAEHRLTAWEKSCWENCVRERNGRRENPHNEAIINFYFARNVNRAMKLERVGWVIYGACMVLKPEKKRPRLRSVRVCRWEIYVRLS